jgi:hypothetical protein
MSDIDTPGEGQTPQIPTGNAPESLRAGDGGVTPAAAPDDNSDNPDFGNELATIDFGQVLGGPLVAAVNAEAQASMVTLQFVEAVGFTKPQSGDGNQARQVQTVDFTYGSEREGTDTTNSLTVPLLSILPIPSMRVSQLSVDLNVKLHSMYKSASSNSMVTTTNIGTGGGFFSLFSPVDMQCTIVDKSASSTSDTVSRDYTMSVKMLAVQDAMPAGLAKVLQILEDTITPSVTPATPK